MEKFSKITEKVEPNSLNEFFKDPSDQKIWDKLNELETKLNELLDKAVYTGDLEDLQNEIDDIKSFIKYPNI